MTLNDPATPTISLGAQTNPTACGATDGTIPLTFTNVPNGSYTLNYVDGMSNAQTFTGVTVTSGVATITNLGAGVYNDITIAVSGCTSTDDIDATLTDPTAPTIPTVDPLITNNAQPVISGTADAGNSLTIVVAGATYNTTADAGGVWTVDTSSDPPTGGTFMPNTNGDNEVAVTATAGGCNSFDATTNELTIDTTNPAVPSVVNQSTNDTTPTIAGAATVAAGETLTVTINGVTYTDGDGNLTLTSGTWTLTIPVGNALVENTYEVRATVTDLAGNSTDDPTSNELLVDTTGPFVTFSPLSTTDTTPPLSGATDDAAATITATLEGTTYPTINGGSTWTLADNTISPALADGTYSVEVSATDVLGNTTTVTGQLIIDTTGPVITFNPLLTNDETPALSGTINELTSAFDLTVDGSTYPATNNGNGTWSLPDNTIAALAEGSFDISIAAVDQLGNTSNESFIGQLAIDLTTPQVTMNPRIINDRSPEVTGTVDDPQASVVLTIRNVAYSATNNGDSTWTLPSGAIQVLNEGVFEVLVVASDSAGNEGTVTEAQGLTIDLTAPLASVNALETFDQTPQLTGSVSETTATVTVEVGGQTRIASNNGDGTWTVANDSLAPLNVGILDVIVRAVDLAGNDSTDTSTDELRILPALVVPNEGQEITVSSFLASWANPGGGVANYLLDISSDRNFEEHVAQYENFEVIGRSERVENLDYSASYFYRVRALYGSGDLSDWSDTIAVRTATDPATAIDSLALVEIYNATGGDDWIENSNWLTGRLPDWYGVTVEEARVTAVRLDSNALVGQIDSVAAGLDRVTELDVSFNELTDVGDLSALSSLQQLNLSGNRLQFGTLEALSSLPATMLYTDQQQVLEQVRRLLEVNGTFTINREVTGAENVYTWYRDSVATDDEGPTIDLTIAGIEDEATYYVEVNNPLFPDLTLVSSQVIIRVSSEQRDRAALLVLYDSAGGEGWTNGVNWRSEDNFNLWTGLTFTGNRVTGIDLANSNVVGYIPDDLADIAGLQSINLSRNSINRIPDLTRLENLQTLDVSNNQLEFDDLEPNVSIPDFLYADQAAFGPQNVEIKLPKGEDYEIRIPIGGEANEYQWSVVGEVASGDMADAIGKKHRIEKINYENQGAYTLTVENPNLPGLVLTSRPQSVLATVNVGFDPVYRDFDDNLSLLTNGTSTLMRIIAPNQPFDTVNVAALEADGLSFTEVVTGDYLVGLRSDSLIIRGSEVGDTIQFLPTYYSDAFLWEEADTIQIRDDFFGDTILVQQRPRELTEDDGDGEVKLTVESLLADLVNGQARGEQVQARRKVKRAGCSLRRRRTATGGRIAEDTFELVAYKETDDEGRVTFNNLPSGTYRLTIEYPGIPMDPTSFIEFEINEGGMEQESLTLEATVAEEGIAVELVEALGIFRRYFRNLSVYPNPATDYIHVAYDELKSKNVVVELYSLQGQLMQRKPLDRRYAAKETLDITEVPSGLYLLRMIDTDRGKNIVSFRVMVKKP